MVYEYAHLTIKAGSEAAFEAAAAQAAPFFKSSKGCLSFKLLKSVEAPLSYTLVVGWETIENHMVDFRESDNFTQWRQLVSPHFAEAPKVNHEQVVLTAF
ncbi:antibiotic biosynthesis monooxygenase [Pigmentiphaga aceris]|uniref:Antibiotic biosynthesis monooxygenase n=1 Tax=Pigmentiphaga aceris TaxID=1940612 RepID=A0A5C0AWI7_9BURK|nr:antibiotic biosynthesis monooxygenase [Pigmentiphaga aceris]QEI06688.1 antibiotic biosynthesis monooxygenase [Pigmentiphaga aceris]